MKLFKVADFNSKEFGDHFKNNEKYTEKTPENQSWYFVNPEKWEPCWGTHNICCLPKVIPHEKVSKSQCSYRMKSPREGGAADHGPDPGHQPDTNINIKNQGTSTKTVLL